MPAWLTDGSGGLQANAASSATVIALLRRLVLVQLPAERVVSGPRRVGSIDDEP
jgi:hypothetical protein